MTQSNGTDNILKRFGNPCPLDAQTVYNFYYNRISTIEEKSCILENALIMLKIAQNNNIKPSVVFYFKFN